MTPDIMLSEALLKFYNQLVQAAGSEYSFEEITISSDPTIRVKFYAVDYEGSRKVLNFIADDDGDFMLLNGYKAFVKSHTNFTRDLRTYFLDLVSVIGSPKFGGKIVESIVYHPFCGRRPPVTWSGNHVMVGEPNE